MYRLLTDMDVATQLSMAEVLVPYWLVNSMCAGTASPIFSMLVDKLLGKSVRTAILEIVKAHVSRWGISLKICHTKLSHSV